MIKIWKLLISVLAVLAICVVASASASAAACTAEVGAQCLEFLGELTPEATFEVLGAKSSLTLVGIFSVLCNDFHAENVLLLEVAGKPIAFDKLALTFSGGCKVAGHATCKVAEPITTVAIGGTLGTIAAGTATATFKPEAGTEFAKVTISGCEQEAVIKVTGEQLCKVPAITTQAVEHEITCAASESNLKDGTKLTEFEATVKARATGPLAGDPYAILQDEI
jgi:hypothetical protein